MKKDSWSKSRCEEPILFHHQAHASQQKSVSFLTIDKVRTHLSSKYSQHLFIVSEAYQEAGGFDYIEEILMQRDHIID